MKARKSVLTLHCKIALLLFGVLLVSCNVPEEVGKTVIRPGVEILDEAIETLENSSAGWRAVLDKTISELEANSHTLVKNDVSTVLTNAVQDVGIEARCTVDFMRDRVKEDLIRLRAQFTGESLSRTPVLCTPNPSSIDYAFVDSGNLTSLTIDGYNLDSGNIKVYLIDDQGNRNEVTDDLAIPTHYIMTLNLGSNGIPITPSSDRLEFELPNETRTVNINQPRSVEQTIIIPPVLSERLCPDKIGGNRDFSGNGPDVTATANLYVKNNTELWIKVTLHAKETKSDWTEAYKEWNWSVWPGTGGARITGFTPIGTSTATYRDNNHQLDTPNITGSALVQRFDIIGDTDGDDIGNCTLDDVYMKVQFNQIEIRYIEE
ncbi:MAG: hypothetical protein GY805_29070 [Chloroflexi bacterium]|nr:hypothetical protein [Chloroflexota bacterium]